MIIYDILRIGSSETPINRNPAARVEFPNGIFSPVKGKQKVTFDPICLYELNSLHGVEGRVNNDMETCFQIAIGCVADMVAN